MKRWCGWWGTGSCEDRVPDAGQERRAGKPDTVPTTVSASACRFILFQVMPQDLIHVPILETVPSDQKYPYQTSDGRWCIA